MDGFTLDERLRADTIPVASLDLSELLLMNDRRWPWLILVPRRPGVTEILDLSPAERASLMEEAARAAGALKAIGPVDKLNIGALGNKVRQLHLHVLARREGDPAWPNPVWGFGMSERYGAREAEDLIAALKGAMPRS